MDELALIEALERIQAVYDRASRTAEYANGYNSIEYVHGRLEGLELAMRALRGPVSAGQWSGGK